MQGKSQYFEPSSKHSLSALVQHPRAFNSRFEYGFQLFSVFSGFTQWSHFSLINSYLTLFKTVMNNDKLRQRRKDTERTVNYGEVIDLEADAGHGGKVCDNDQEN